MVVEFLKNAEISTKLEILCMLKISNPKEYLSPKISENSSMP
jgi:hypothetical protein